MDDKNPEVESKHTCAYTCDQPPCAGKAVQGSIGVALRSTRQSRRLYQAQMSRVLEDDVHRKKTGGGKNSGTYKEAQSIQMYPTGRDRKDMLATPEFFTAEIFGGN